MGRAQKLEGHRFGDFDVLEFSHRNAQRAAYYNVKCWRCDSVMCKRASSIHAGSKCLCDSGIARRYDTQARRDSYKKKIRVRAGGGPVAEIRAKLHVSQEALAALIGQGCTAKTIRGAEARGDGTRRPIYAIRLKQIATENGIKMDTADLIAKGYTGNYARNIASASHCAQCGQLFDVSSRVLTARQKRSNSGIYCGYKCAAKARVIARNFKPKLLFECFCGCGEVVSRYQSQLPKMGRVFASRECAMAWTRANKVASSCSSVHIPVSGARQTKVDELRVRDRLMIGIAKTQQNAKRQNRSRFSG